MSSYHANDPQNIETDEMQYHRIASHKINQNKKINTLSDENNNNR